MEWVTSRLSPVSPGFPGFLTQSESEAVTDAELEATTESGAESAQGEWVEEEISNPRAAQYQAKITGQPGQAYQLNGVSFDGLSDTGELLEAKGPGYARLFQQGFADSVQAQIQSQVERQVAAAAGRRIVWHIAEDEALPVFQQVVDSVPGASNVIRLVFTAP